MHHFKALFLVILLSFTLNSHAESQASVSVMDGFDRVEDFYLSVMCGKGNQVMDTALGRMIKTLLCRNKNEVINTHDEQEENSFNRTADINDYEWEQDKYIDQLLKESEQTPNFLDFDFVTIQAGTFKMGSPKREEYRWSDEDQVRVTISRSFEIMTKEVTQMQWFTIMGDNPSLFSERKYCEDDFIVIQTFDEEKVSLCPNHPVETVSWNDIQVFIKKLNKQENLSNCNGTPDSASGCYRLPTEAEWEFAARSGSKTAYYFGNNPDDLHDHAWYWDNSNKQTHAVGLKTPNDNGLYDIHGNVWEWVQDKYTKRLSGGTNPLHTSSGSYRVFRGGSWGFNAEYLRSAGRYDVFADLRGSFIGFRLLRTQ